MEALEALSALRSKQDEAESNRPESGQPPARHGYGSTPKLVYFVKVVTACLGSID